MIDIHTHLIPNVDDGSKGVDVSINAFKEAIDAGFSDIILTSHYIPEYNETEPNRLVSEREKLQKKLEENNLNLKLHSGMEIYVSDNLSDLIDKKSVLTLDRSKYILIELPMNSKIYFLDFVIGSLFERGLKVILAHPERYLVVKDNPDLVEEYIQKGCLMQCNFGSILGYYGKTSKGVVKYLLKNDMVHFLASDCHNCNGIYLDIPKALKKIKKIVGDEKLEELTTGNQRKILENKDW